MRALFVGFLLLAASPVTAAEKYVGGNTDVRTVLAFKAADAAIQKVLPQEWEPDVAASGPAKDINLRVTFIDRLFAQDAEGKTLPSARIVTLGIPARKKGSEGRGTMLFLIYTSGESGGPYGVSIKADTKMEREVEIDPAGKAAVEESWQFKAPDGNAIELEIKYARGPLKSGKAESLLYSAAKPSFYRIYRYEQLEDAVREAGADRVQKIVFKASGPKLSPLFDGSEQLIGVTSVPSYTRQTYLPGS